jgi:hypothetical protein
MLRNTLLVLLLACTIIIASPTACKRSKPPSPTPEVNKLMCRGEEHVKTSDLKDLNRVAHASNKCVLELDRVSIGGITCSGNARVIVRDSTLSKKGYVIHASRSCNVQIERSRLVSADDNVALFLNDVSTMTLIDAEIVGQISGQHRYLKRITGLDKSRWSAPGEVERQTMIASRCLGITGFRAAHVLAWRQRWIRDGRKAADFAHAPRFHPNKVARCAKRLALVGKPPTVLSAAARRWAAAITPFVARYTQERNHYTQGDYRDGEDRGKAIAAQVDSAAATLSAATAALRTAVVELREGAQKTWVAKYKTNNELQPYVYAVILATDDLAFAAGGDTKKMLPALEAVAGKCIALGDILAKRPELRKTVDSFWHPESGNATRWSALEKAFNKLCVEVKKLRRRRIDDRVEPSPDDLLKIAQQYENAFSHFGRLRFN